MHATNERHISYFQIIWEEDNSLFVSNHFILCFPIFLSWFALGRIKGGEAENLSYA